MNKLMTLLVQKHLGTITGVKINIGETSLVGTELYRDMVAGKTKWTAVDDEWLDQNAFPKDDPKDKAKVTLEAQRIRMVRISIKPLVGPQQKLEKEIIQE